MRVFMGLVEIAGYYRNLKYGFDLIGVPCTFINLYTHNFNYGGSDENWMVKSLMKLRSGTDDDNYLFKVADSLEAGILRLDSILMNVRSEKIRKLYADRLRETVVYFHRSKTMILELILLWSLFVWALLRHDVFILGYNTRFFDTWFSNTRATSHFLDLKLLKFFRKKIVYVYHGSDARPAYVDGGILIQNNAVEEDMEKIATLAQSQKEKIMQRAQFADFMISLRTECHFFERPIILWQAIGNPATIPPQFQTAPDPDYKNPQFSENATCRVLHCPSNPVAKGTEHIRQAIAQIQQEGYSIHLVEIINQPNYRVHEELQKCDFVIDQAFSPSGLGGFGMEAAFWGKLVILCGYDLFDWQALLPEHMIAPVHYCHPDELTQAIRKMVVDVDYRKYLGQQAKHFVEKSWHSASVAKRMRQLIQGPVPSEWYFDPNQTDYFYGYGLEEEKLRAFLKTYLDEKGEECLFLSDKPRLREKIMAFAYKSQPSLVGAH